MPLWILFSSNKHDTVSKLILTSVTRQKGLVKILFSCKGKMHLSAGDVHWEIRILRKMKIDDERWSAINLKVWSNEWNKESRLETKRRPSELDSRQLRREQVWGKREKWGKARRWERDPEAQREEIRMLNLSPLLFFSCNRLKPAGCVSVPVTLQKGQCC